MRKRRLQIAYFTGKPGETVGRPVRHRPDY
jgi:hypothetical protein